MGPFLTLNVRFRLLFTLYTNFVLKIHLIIIWYIKNFERSLNSLHKMFLFNDPSILNR